MKSFLAKKMNKVDRDLDIEDPYYKFVVDS